MQQFIIKNGKRYKVIYCTKIRKNGTVYYPKNGRFFRFLVEMK